MRFLRFSLFICLVLSACSPQKRLGRLVKNHPELFKNQVVKDTTYIQTVRKDTVFSHEIDSLILREDKLTIKYYHYRDSIYLSGECEGDTIIKEVPVFAPVVKEKYTPPFIKISAWILWIILIVLGLYLFFRAKLKL